MSKLIDWQYIIEQTNCHDEFEHALWVGEEG